MLKKNRKLSAFSKKEQVTINLEFTKDLHKYFIIWRIKMKVEDCWVRSCVFMIYQVGVIKPKSVFGCKLLNSSDPSIIKWESAIWMYFIHICLIIGYSIIFLINLTRYSFLIWLHKTFPSMTQLYLAWRRKECRRGRKRQGERWNKNFQIVFDWLELMMCLEYHQKTEIIFFKKRGKPKSSKNT